jgi:hypothetical protein
VFNYCLNGNTYFDKIKYSTPASCFKLLPDGSVQFCEYFNIISFLKNSSKKESKKDIFAEAVERWRSIIQQLNYVFDQNKASLTLTAGLDSRIIAGGFIKAGIDDFNTFTFGHDESLDVIYAKLLAKKFGLSHKHYYPEKEFFKNFEPNARNVFDAGDSLVSIYRAHRLDAYSKVMNRSTAIVTGMAGSDLVRGIGYDGLIVSAIAWHCWRKRNLETFFENNDIISNLSAIGLNSFEYLLDRKDAYEYVNHPMHYLFKVIIPLHFGQDVMMNMNMGWSTYLPFLDLDYLEFLSKTPYLDVSDYSNFDVRNFKRRTEGLFYSARLLKELNPQLASFTLGKGYSPDDIVRSQIIFLTKGALHKIRERNKYKVANFSYGDWYWKFLMRYFDHSDLSDIGLDGEYLTNILQNLSHSGGELYFLDFTKAVNVHLAVNL